MRFVDKETEKILRELIRLVLTDDKRIFRSDVLYTSAEILFPIWALFPEGDHCKLGLVLTDEGNQGRVHFRKVGVTTKNLSYFKYISNQ